MRRDVRRPLTPAPPDADPFFFGFRPTVSYLCPGRPGVSEFRPTHDRLGTGQTGHETGRRVVGN